MRFATNTIRIYTSVPSPFGLTESNRGSTRRGTVKGKSCISIHGIAFMGNDLAYAASIKVGRLVAEQCRSQDAAFASVVHGTKIHERPLRDQPVRRRSWTQGANLGQHGDIIVLDGVTEAAYHMNGALYARDDALDMVGLDSGGTRGVVDKRVIALVVVGGIQEFVADDAVQVPEGAMRHHPDQAVVAIGYPVRSYTTYAHDVGALQRNTDFPIVDVILRKITVEAFAA